MVARVVGALALLVALNVAAQAAPTCGVPVGRIITLKSVELDPDVYVWDARQRVQDYAQGSWGSSRDVISHTVLAKSGTHAIVVSCAPGVVAMKNDETSRDALGIKLLSGPNRGRYGWITSDDVHRIAKR